MSEEELLEIRIAQDQTELIVAAYPAWNALKEDLVKQPKYSEAQENLYFDCWLGGLLAAQTLMMTRHD
jgi:hypothetical protein